MINLKLDKQGGINKGDIVITENDNKSEIYIIQLTKYNNIIDLTNKSVQLTIINKDNRLGDMLNLPIFNASEGKVKFEITKAVSKDNGDYIGQIKIINGAGYEEGFPYYFDITVRIDLATELSGEIVANPSFEILNTSLTKIQEWDNYFKSVTPNLEQKYTERLNQVANSVNDKATKSEVLEINKKLDSQRKVLVYLNEYSSIAKEGTNSEDWSIVFNHVFANVVNNTSATITWNGQLKVKSTINLPKGVNLQGTGLPYSGLTPTVDFVGDYIIKDNNIKTHNSIKNLYLDFKSNKNVGGIFIKNPYDYSELSYIVGDSCNNTFIEVGDNKEISQTLKIDSCLCYGLTTCKNPLVIIKNAQEFYIVNNKFMYSGIGTKNSCLCDGLTTTTFINNSFGFTSDTALKFTCTDLVAKRVHGNLVTGNLFEQCNGTYAIELIGNSQSQFEGSNNTIRDNSYFLGSSKIKLDYISDTYICDWSTLEEANNARRTTFIQKYADNSSDAYGKLSIGIDGKNLITNSNFYSNSINFNGASNKISKIFRNATSSADEGIDFILDDSSIMRLKNNDICNWRSGGGLVLWSSNGTGFKITISDDGNLTVARL